MSLQQAEVALGQQPSAYFHNGAWKEGFYDPVSKVVLGGAEGRVTTVINNAKQKYIDNLKAASP